MKSAAFLTGIFSLVLFLSFTIKPKDSLRDDVLKYTNEFRKTHKLEKLEMNADMNSIAQKHSQNMAAGKIGFGHDGFARRTEEIKKKLKYTGGFAENVAFGVSTGKDAVELWESSEGHRKNMLGAYKYVGIGVATGKNGQTYFTQIFAD
jgi:uncharacterized protein YkwD